VGWGGVGWGGVRWGGVGWGGTRCGQQGELKRAKHVIIIVRVAVWRVLKRNKNI
jgi:hypothetical protein